MKLAFAEIRIGKWLLRVDPRVTRAAYELLAATEGVGSRCTCDYCRNFDAALPRVFPPEALSLLERLGIDARSPLEVYECCRLRPGDRLYGGWYLIIGHLLEGEAETQVHVTDTGVSTVRFLDHEPLVTGFGFLFTAKGFPPLAEAFRTFRPYPVLVLDFTAVVPWVLDTAEPE